MPYRPPKVLVLGDVMLDLWISTRARAVNPEGAAMIATGSSEERDATLGGAGLVATLLRSIGLRVKLMGKLGNDTQGATVHALLHEFGLGCKNIAFSDDVVTPAKMRFINEHGVVTYRYDEERDQSEYLADNSSHFDFDLFSAHAERADIVVVADYGKGYCQAHGKKIIEAARYYRTLTVVGAKPAVLAEYEGADVVKVNAAEAKEFLELQGLPWSADRHETVKMLCERMNCSVAVVTASRNGAVYASRLGDSGYITFHTAAKPCFPSVVNCVGAGDAFMAGFVADLVLPPKAKRRVDLIKLHTAVAAGAATAAQYLTRGYPEIDPATPFLAAYNRLAEVDSAAKIVPFDQAAALCHAWRSTNEAVVFTNGCFDLLHHGHVSLLEQAKQQGKRLVVAVNSDQSVRLLKGAQRPVQSLETRAKVIASLGCVDAVVVLDEEDFAAQPALRAMITEFVPDVLVKGAQYKEEEIVGFEEMVNRDSPGRIWRCPMVDNISTTSTVERINNAQR